MSTLALVDLVRVYGRGLHSFLVLEPGLRTWTEDDAAVAYVDRGGYWVAASAPLCAAERSAAVSRRFAKAARRAGGRALFFGVTDRFLDRLANDPRWDALQIGLAPVWRPADWERTVARASKLRNRLQHAHRQGVTTRAVDTAEIGPGAPLRDTLAALARAWVDRHPLPPMGFLVRVELFGHAELRRYFLAEHEGRPVGLAVCVPIPGRRGWLLEDLILGTGAPSGTSERLVDTAMRALADAEVVSLGLVALAGLDEPASGRHPWWTRFLRTTGRMLAGLYDFRGLYRFREKLKPAQWEPVYVVTDGPLNGFAIRAILMAFAEGRLPAFALRWLGRVIARWWRS